MPILEPGTYCLFPMGAQRWPAVVLSADMIPRHMIRLYNPREVCCVLLMETLELKWVETRHVSEFIPITLDGLSGTILKAYEAVQEFPDLDFWRSELEVQRLAKESFPRADIEPLFVFGTGLDSKALLEESTGLDYKSSVEAATSRDIKPLIEADLGRNFKSSKTKRPYRKRSWSPPDFDAEPEDTESLFVQDHGSSSAKRRKIDRLTNSPESSGGGDSSPAHDDINVPSKGTPTSAEIKRKIAERSLNSEPDSPYVDDIISFVEHGDYAPKLLQSSTTGYWGLEGVATEVERGEQLVRSAELWQIVAPLHLPDMFELLTRRVEVLLPWPSLEGLLFAKKALTSRPNKGEVWDAVEAIIIQFLADDFLNLIENETSNLLDLLREFQGVEEKVLRKRASQLEMKRRVSKMVRFEDS